MESDESRRKFEKKMRKELELEEKEYEKKEKNYMKGGLPIFKRSINFKRIVKLINPKKGRR